MLLPRADRAAGIYVHIPFCRKLCPYCDFAVSIRQTPPFEAYFEALAMEFSQRIPSFQDRNFQSIYIGGGTPSLTPPRQLARLFQTLRQASILRDHMEVTIEANPTDITADILRAYEEIGITRISLGCQSFHTGYLARLGRVHDGPLAQKALERITEDWHGSISVDLIYAGPGYERNILLSDLRTLQDYSPPHVSIYELTVEPQTVFGRLHRQGKLELPDEDLSHDLFLEICAYFHNAGLLRYEVSSFGRVDSWSHHNRLYWTGAEYLGLGVGAHSLLIKDNLAIRWQNSRRLRDYLNAPLQPEEESDIAPSEHLHERLMTALRCTEGINVSALASQFDDRQVARARQLLECLVADGAMAQSEDSFIPTELGMNFADAFSQKIWKLEDSQ